MVAAEGGIALSSASSVASIILSPTMNGDGRSQFGRRKNMAAMLYPGVRKQDEMMDMGGK